VCGGGGVSFARGFEERHRRIWLRAVRVTTQPIQKSVTKNPEDGPIAYNSCFEIALIARGVLTRYDGQQTCLHQGSGLSSQPARSTVSSQLPRISTMSTESQRRRDRILSSLNAAVEAMTIAKELASVTSAKVVFSSVSAILTMIRVGFLLVRPDQPQADALQDSMINDADYVELGLVCAGVCEALDRGLKGKRTDELSKAVLAAIEQLTTSVKPEMRFVHDRLTVLRITGPWRRSRERLSSRANEMRSLGFSTRIKIRSPPGS
jgi:hypothetical protein